MTGSHGRWLGCLYLSAVCPSHLGKDRIKGFLWAEILLASGIWDAAGSFLCFRINYICHRVSDGWSPVQLHLVG